MTDRKIAPEDDSETTETNHAARRQFLKRAGQVAVTTQAVTLLLAAGGKPVQAGIPSSDVSPGTADQTQLDGGEDEKCADSADGGGNDNKNLCG